MALIKVLIKKLKSEMFIENKRWFKKQTQNLSRVLQNQEQDDNYSENCLLINATSIRKKQISISDYGGGIGEEYFKLKKSVKIKKLSFIFQKKKKLLNFSKEKV